ADRAPAYGIPAEVIDGNDVVVVEEAVGRAVDRARKGDGPTVLEAQTYRHYGHSRTDPATYRPADEVRAWLARDPSIVARERLTALGVSDEEMSTVDDQVNGATEMAVANAKAAPDADPAEALT